jgi:hypothetical protein
MLISYRNQIIILVLWILVVTALFKFISDRQVAAVIAGLGFILIPFSFLISELKNKMNPFHIFTLIFFLSMSAVPIFGMRVVNWGVEFNSLNLLGIEAQFLHKISSYFYMLIMISTVYCFIKERKLLKK